nr:MAG TPA: hypothetical protein [Caudoviricetes sp.]
MARGRKLITFLKITYNTHKARAYALVKAFKDLNVLIRL